MAETEEREATSAVQSPVPKEQRDLPPSDDGAGIEGMPAESSMYEAEKDFLSEIYGREQSEPGDLGPYRLLEQLSQYHQRASPALSSAALSPQSMSPTPRMERRHSLDPKSAAELGSGPRSAKFRILPMHALHSFLEAASSTPTSRVRDLYANTMEEYRIRTELAKDLGVEPQHAMDALWATQQTYTARNQGAVRQQIIHHLEHTVACSRFDMTPKNTMTAAALSLRDRLIEYLNDSNVYFTAMSAKRAYYMSIEFLIGRSFSNAVNNMRLESEFRGVLAELGTRMEEIVQLEHDAGLGNGGLGRLAACYLDSMATLNYPVWGYGIRYKYGMFRQEIINKRQREFPDFWLAEGTPWEIERNDVLYAVGFYGVVERTDTGGVDKYKWHAAQTVCAKAYDTPVPGYDTTTCLNLRLWSSQPSEEFDLVSFNKGDYASAIASRQEAEAITSVLYPDDSTHAGLELRLKQQYFFSSASLQDILARFVQEGHAFDDLPDFVAIQLNDTHPTISVVELIRLLVDVHGMPFEAALSISRRVFFFTNHTVLPEALERWPVSLMAALLPRHMQLIYDINWEFLESIRADHDEDFLRAVSIIGEHPEKHVRMANLAIVMSGAVNGVAELHTSILKSRTFKQFHELYPEKFCNKTNGITSRRWLKVANPQLSALITKKLGTDAWVKDLSVLRQLEEFADERGFQQEWMAVKRLNKDRLAAHIQRLTGIEVCPQALFDVHVKRIHEYKRQLLNILSVIYRYIILKRMSPEQRENVVPRCTIFGGKSAAAYARAKLIINLINVVASVVNEDKETRCWLTVVFLPDYNVSLAEIIIPATDMSQHISTTGTEASGTSNMKFVLNSALILGTLDGATIEINEESDGHGVITFGISTEAEVEEIRAGYAQGEQEENCVELDSVLAEIADGLFRDEGQFQPIVDELSGRNDYYLIYRDFEDYLRGQQRVDSLYRDQVKWASEAIRLTASVAKFSSDRAATEYADMWGISAFPLPTSLCEEENRLVMDMDPE
ncbi:Glycosyl transferase, family 35 [Carpediemonas membranifera]|uniref:Alpha-1,4 glucan phosphorylase n=1 Tax=Carpediemonas membranifera TaxID=201153 RepID=A0A8J6B6Z0_9EUKA|nr:Glycosyl transferase, family 35 [Carpediemonas membranifera]|eukprot:KAG9391272.1 Glycosyl transferase, family 35 [Carpediemonas membranifera]